MEVFMRKIGFLFCFIFCFVIGCSNNSNDKVLEQQSVVTSPPEVNVDSSTVEPETPPAQKDDVLGGTPDLSDSPSDRGDDILGGTPDLSDSPPVVEKKPEKIDNGFLIVVDAGHQGTGDSTPEPIGPGSSETKARVTSGTRGTTTGLAEFELNLMVSLKLRDVLAARGYRVVLVRDSHDVNMSNSERAAVANDAGADAFIRIHANGADDSSENGILTICPTPANPYMGALYEACKSLSDSVLDGAVNATGAARKYVWETDSMSGINWCKVPVTIVEMGFMTNPTEDRNLADDSYQDKLAQGIADGIDAFFQR